MDRKCVFPNLSNLIIMADGFFFVAVKKLTTNLRFARGRTKINQVWCMSVRPSIHLCFPPPHTILYRRFTPYCFILNGCLAGNNAKDNNKNQNRRAEDKQTDSGNPCKSGLCVTFLHDKLRDEFFLWNTDKHATLGFHFWHDR